MRCANLYEAHQAKVALLSWTFQNSMLEEVHPTDRSWFHGGRVEEFSAEDHLRTGGTITDHRR